jgi:hypothetical protein
LGCILEDPEKFATDEELLMILSQKQSQHDLVILRNDGPYTVEQAEHNMSLREYKPGGRVYDMQAKRIEAVKSQVHRRQNGGKMPGPTYLWRFDDFGRQGVLKAWRDAGKVLVLEPGTSPAHFLLALESGVLYEDYSMVFQNFSTFRADVKLSAGKFYYELDIKHIQGVAQFGWATEGFNSKRSSKTFNTQTWRTVSSTKSLGEGVGDNVFSWGFDGVGVSKWGDDNSSAFGVKWREGDVLGLACDMMNKTVSFSANGSFEPPLKVAFDKIDADCIAPALSAIASSTWWPTLGTCSVSTRRPMRHTCPCTLRPRNRLQAA